jgi:hypothetical protein
MKTQITKVSIFQNAKFLSVLYLPIGLLYALIGLAFIATGLDYLMFTGIIFLLAPIWLTALTYMMIAIFAVIYNFIASKIGGIEFELTEISDNKEFSKDDFGE